MRGRIAVAVWLGTALALAVAGLIATASLGRALGDGGFYQAEVAADLRRQMWTLALVGSTVVALCAWLVAGWISRPVRRAGEVATRFGAGDLTARIPERGTDDVAVLARQFNQMADSVTRMIDAQRHFISDTAHELRTPTAALLATASALENPSTRDEAAALVAPQLRRLSTLTEDLLALARFDSAREVLRAEPVDLVGLCLASVDGLGDPGQVRVLRIGGEPVEVEADAMRVQTVVRNLVANGLRHGAPPVTVMVQATDPGGQVVVTDDGPGIPLATGDRLFERFVRGDEARHGTGSGLGLAIARENARLHGGELSLDEGGHAFRLTLPSAAPSGAHIAPPAPVVRRPGMVDWLVSRLLVVALSLASFGFLLTVRPSTGLGAWTNRARNGYVWPSLGWPTSAALGVAGLLLGALLMHVLTRVTRRRWPAVVVALVPLALALASLVVEHSGDWIKLFLSLPLLASALLEEPPVGSADRVRPAVGRPGDAP